MKYYICEGNAEGEYNASSKARKDVETILDQQGYKKLFVPTKNGIQKNKLLKVLQFITYKKNKIVWDKSLSKLQENDIVVIQYPIINTTLKVEKIIEKYAKKANIVALIHDMDSLRYLPENQGKMLCNRVKQEDKNILNACSYIIAHNEKMKEELIKLGNSNEKIVTLNIFDYIITEKLQEIEHKKDAPVIIAGNLSKEKAKYLSYLKEIKNVEFNLYGVGYKEEAEEKNIHYIGAFKPEDLLNHLEGSFGLVWDGVSKETCIGGFGKYLKYNNPHKASMYLAAQIPVIVWEEAAIADFIIKNQIGITVKNLDEIHNKIEKLTNEEYEIMRNNIKEISKKLKTGNYLTQAIKKVEEKINE